MAHILNHYLFIGYKPGLHSNPQPIGAALVVAADEAHAQELLEARKGRMATNNATLWIRKGYMPAEGRGVYQHVRLAYRLMERTQPHHLATPSVMSHAINTKGQFPPLAKSVMVTDLISRAVARGRLVWVGEKTQEQVAKETGGW